MVQKMHLQYQFGEVLLTRLYPFDHPIWLLPEEKRKRKMVADIQRELAVEADRLAMVPYQIRG